MREIYLLFRPLRLAVRISACSALVTCVHFDFVVRQVALIASANDEQIAADLPVALVLCQPFVAREVEALSVVHVNCY